MARPRAASSRAALARKGKRIRAPPQVRVRSLETGPRQRGVLLPAGVGGSIPRSSRARNHSNAVVAHDGSLTPESSVRGDDLVHDERAGVGVERRHRPERHRRVVLAVADREAEDERRRRAGRGPPRRCPPTESSRDRAGPLRLEIADHDAGRAIEQAGVPELGQEPVEDVALKLDLLEADDAAPEVRLESRPDGRREQPAQPPAGVRSPVRRRSSGRRGRRGPARSARRARRRTAPGGGSPSRSP